MGAIMETLVAEQLPESMFVEVSPPPVAMRTVGAISRSTRPRRATAERWCSELGPQDLNRLLCVLENAVLPQMIAGYSPATMMPIGRARRKI